MGSRLALAGLMMLCLTAQGRCAEQGRFHRLDTQAAVKKLVQNGSADALAAAALLKQMGADTDTGAYALSAHAVQLAPGRAELAWLAVRMCDTSDSCDARQTEQHLRAVDPGNAAGWVGELGRAQRRNDPVAIDAALDAIGKAQAFRVYFEPLVVATTQQLITIGGAGENKPSASARASMTMTMIGVVAGAVLPGTRIFSYSCQGYELQVNGRRARCQSAAQVIERSDAYIVEGLGLSLQQKLWPEDTPEYAAISERRRIFQYRLEEYNQLPVSSSRPAEFPADYLDVARHHVREQDVALVYLERAQIPAQPPPGWVSAERPRVP
ncbi:MAG: hypothetical protein JOY91_14265 [Sinobacteraceae bacterium]|nr:hypothetical protein [Nevskiaceae bacterium]